MVKLRLNCEVQVLVYRLNISPATVSQILLKWLTAMDNSLRSLIMWPDREALRKTMPECFHTSFGTNVTVVIDCFIFLSNVLPTFKQELTTPLLYSQISGECLDVLVYTS